MKKVLPLFLLCLLLSGCTGLLARENPQPPVSEVPDAALTFSPRPAPTAPAATIPPAPATAEPVVTAPPRRETPAPVHSVRPAVTPAPTPTPTPAPAPAPTPLPTAVPPAPTSTAEPQTPSDEQVSAAFRRAEEAYGWFEASPMPTSEERREVDGVAYQKVNYPGISSLTELRAYLRDLFSDGIVDTLLPIDGTRYVDLDGALYARCDASEAGQDQGAECRQVLREGEDSMSVQVTVEALDPKSGAVTDIRTYTFPYERVGEKWIFTSFSLT